MDMMMVMIIGILDERVGSAYARCVMVVMGMSDMLLLGYEDHRFF